MTSIIFENWFHDFVKKMIEQGRNIILILNNASCHLYGAKLKSMKLQYITSKMTFKITHHIKELFIISRWNTNIPFYEDLHLDETKSASDILISTNIHNTILIEKTY